ncbi:MAG: hypothetical protein QM757_47115 [Paludibaculum sp.]
MSLFLFLILVDDRRPADVLLRPVHLAGLQVLFGFYRVSLLTLAIRN